MTVNINITATLNGKKFRNVGAAFNNLARNLDLNRSEVKGRVKKAFTDYIDEVIEDLIKKHSTPYSGKAPAKSLSLRSGRLHKLLRKSPYVRGRGLGDIEAGLILPPRVAIHEEGGIIKPKNVKHLTIPLDAALNSDGTPKRRSANDWEDTITKFTPNGNLIMFQRVKGEGRSSKLIPLYILVGKKTKYKQITFKKGAGGSPYSVDTKLGARAMMEKNLLKFTDDLAREIVRGLRGNRRGT